MTAVLGAINLGVHQAQISPSRPFPVYFLEGDIVYPQFAADVGSINPWIPVQAEGD
jgi:hypothetical protein